MVVSVRSLSPAAAARLHLVLIVLPLCVQHYIKKYHLGVCVLEKTCSAPNVFRIWSGQSGGVFQIVEDYLLAYCSKRRWYSGNLNAFQAFALGLIPGRRTCSSSILTSDAFFFACFIFLCDSTEIAENILFVHPSHKNIVLTLE